MNLHESLRAQRGPNLQMGTEIEAMVESAVPPDLNVTLFTQQKHSFYYQTLNSQQFYLFLVLRKLMIASQT